jgi:hypothetical protein
VQRLQEAGGAAHEIETGAAAEAKLVALHPGAKVICSAVPEIAGNRRAETIHDPHELADVDVGEASVYGASLALSSVISFWLITRILAQTYSVSREDDLLGGMWAVVATLFVQRYSYEESVRAALSRVAATWVSFALCFVYLVLLPFHRAD